MQQTETYFITYGDIFGLARIPAPRMVRGAFNYSVRNLPVVVIPAKAGIQWFIQFIPA